MENQPMHVIPYQPEYRKAIRAIHIATASDAARSDPKHHDFSLWMYCDEYLDHETVFLLMDQNEIPRGYILCAENFEIWKENMVPYAQKIKNLGHQYDKMVDGALKQYSFLSKEYPAHLHIDILEDYTGQGHGTMLMNALIMQLKKDHVKGLCLGVDPNNTRAVKFYHHCGFAPIEAQEFGMTLGMKF